MGVRTRGRLFAFSVNRRSSTRMSNDTFLAAALLLPYFAPVFASRFGTLWRGVFLGFLPAFVLGALTIAAGTGGLFAAFLGCFVSALLGFFARSLSLLLRKAGHGRPWSLWVEVIFLALAAGFLLVAGIAPL